MASGGARNRSGPAPVPGSGRSEARGLVFTALPNGGHRGRAPKFPLMPRTVYRWQVEDKSRFQVRDDEATDEVAARELELWRWAWKTPQAAAWAAPGQRWRWHSVAMWVRTAVVCESAEATAADKNSLHRFADQIGLTPAGLAENGWAIAPDEVSAKRVERVRESSPGERPTRRLRAVSS